jgi:hypothetical protein
MAFCVGITIRIARKAPVRKKLRKQTIINAFPAAASAAGTGEEALAYITPAQGDAAPEFFAVDPELPETGSDMSGAVILGQGFDALQHKHATAIGRARQLK